MASASDSRDDYSDIGEPERYGLLRGDQLPEADSDDDEGIDFAELEKVLLESETRAAQHRLEHPKKPKANLEPTNVVLPKATTLTRHQVDGFLAKLLTTVASGRSFSAQNWKGLVQDIAQATTTPEPVAKLALDPIAKYPKVFIVADHGSQCVLSVNTMLSWDMLLSYPRTRAVCDKLLGSA